MARAPTKSLVLEISGDVSKLNTASKAAKSALAAMKGDVENLETYVKRATSDLFGDGIANSTRSAERDFNRLFRSVAANAKAIKAETSQGFALQLFDVGAADEQVRTLTQQAGYLREVAKEAQAAALVGGEFADKQSEIAVAALTNAENLEREAKALDETASAFRQILPELNAHDTATVKSTEISGQKRAALQNLSYQLNDVATMYSLGAKPMQIFASQSGQVIQALQGMSGGAKGLLGVLGGPWGLAFTSALVVVTPLVSKLWDADDAMEEVELGADALGKAQSVLGQMFDLTTGKIDDQNQMLRINALLMARNLEAEAKTRRASSLDAMKRAKEGGAAGFFEAQTVGIAGLEPTTGARNAKALSGLLDLIGTGDGKITRADAIERAEKMDFAGTRVSKDDFIAGLRDAQVADENDNIARQIRESLEKNELAPGLRQDPASPRKSRGGKDEAERAAKEKLTRERSYEDAEAQAQRSVLSALLERAHNEDDRLALQLQLLDGDREAQARERQRAVTDGEMTQKQADALAAIEDRAATLEEEAVREESRQRLLDQQFSAGQEEIDGKLALLRLQSQLAVSLEERRRVALQILAYELEERKRAAERLQNSDDPVEQARGDAQMAQVEREAPLLREQVQKQYNDPVERYLEGLRNAAEHTDEVLDQVRADGLQNLEDGLLGVVTGTESVADAFGRMADQIISDLIRIAIQKTILNAAGSGVFSFLGIGAGTGAATGMPALYSRGGRIDGFAGGGRMISGPGSGTSDSILGLVDGETPILVSNGESINTAAATEKYWPLIQAMNAGALPGFAEGGLVTPTLPRMPSLPRPDELRRDSSMDRLQVDVRAKVDAGPMLDARIEEVSTRTVSSAAQPIVSAAEARTMRNLNRPKLPGGHG